MECKDALSSQLFKDIDDMLLRLHYLNIFKVSKKSRELSDIVEDLKEVFEFPKGGNLPVRSHGSMQVVSTSKINFRYGAYIMQSPYTQG